MKFIKLLLTPIVIVLLLTTPAYAIAKGEFDFADLSPHYGEPKVEIDLSANLIKMIGNFIDNEDPETEQIISNLPEIEQIISNLESIKVRVYSLSGDFGAANSMLNNATQELKTNDWEMLVTVNDNESNEKVRIFATTTSDVIDGVVVMVISPEEGEGDDANGEAVFINITGEIEPDKIAKVIETFDVDID